MRNWPTQHTFNLIWIIKAKFRLDCISSFIFSTKKMLIEQKFICQKVFRCPQDILQGWSRIFSILSLFFKKNLEWYFPFIFNIEASNWQVCTFLLFLLHMFECKIMHAMTIVTKNVCIKQRNENKSNYWKCLLKCKPR